MGDPDDVDNHAAMIGPSYRLTGAVNRGVGVGKTRGSTERIRTAQATSEERRPMDVASRATASSLQRVAAEFEQFSTVKVIIIPLANTFAGDRSFQAKLRSAVQRDLDYEAKQMGLQKHAFTFAVSFESERSDAGKRSYERFDFPVYVLGLGSSERTVTDLMTDHRIPEYLRDTNLYEYAKRNWKGRGGDYGLGMPPDRTKGRFTKVGFLDYERSQRDCTGDLAECMANVIVHELFHLVGLLYHGGSGLMHPRNLRDWGKPVHFSQRDRMAFFGELAQLRQAAVEKP